MPLTFPSSPTNGETYVVGSRTWTWNGSIWEINGTAAGVASVGETELTSDAVTTAKIANSAITTAKIANSSVTVAKIESNPTFTGTVTLPSTTSIGTVSNTEISYVDGVTSAIQTQLNAKANLASPTFTGTPIFGGGAIGGTAGNSVETHRSYATQANGELLKTNLTKTSTGADWTTSAWIMQRAVDVTNMGYIKLGTGIVALGDGTTDSLIVDSSGRVRMPSQPYVRAIVTNSATYTSGFNNIAFNSVSDNVGSHYNASTYTFTAPVAGNYLVQAQCQIKSEIDNGSWAFNFGIYKNESLVVGTYQSPTISKTYMKQSVVGVIKMAVNDSVNIKLLINQSTYIEGSGDARNTLIITLLG
jgi:hypothetical protein